MSPTVGDVVEVAKLAATAVGTSAVFKALQWRAQNRLTDAQAGVQDATADATQAKGQAELLEAAATAVGTMVPHVMELLQRAEARLDAQAAELADVRGQLLRLMGERTEDRVQIGALSSELAHERARNTRTDVYLVALQAWAADAVREIRRLDGTISDPPVPPTDPPTSPRLPTTRPPTD